MVEPVVLDLCGILPQAQKPFPPAVKHFLDTFPLDELGWKLRRRCFRSVKVVARMRERIALLRLAVDRGLTPFEMQSLFVLDILRRLEDLDLGLEREARAIVSDFK